MSALALDRALEAELARARALGDKIRAGQERRAAAGLPWGRRRVHPAPKVGDVFGRARIVRVLGRGFQGRSDLRVEIECTVCGRRSETFEYLLRRGTARCVGRGPRTHE